MIKSAKRVPLRTPTAVSIELLRFDTSNPRYSEDRDVDTRSQREIIRYLIERADLQELLDSITYSGYIDIDPLIVLKEDDYLIVLEGNRRLAAINLLRDAKLAADCEVKITKVSEAIKETLKSVTVYAVEERSEAKNFIGFKHINGPHRWDSVAKGRFAAEWYKEELEAGRSVTLADIAHKMGDRHDTIKRMVAGIFVLDQAKREGLFDVGGRYPGRTFAFSHLYTALTRPQYRTYLGLPAEWRGVDPQPDPIPSDHLDKLRQVLLWLYGSADDDIPPVVSSQNPHVKQLGEVLAKPKALAMLVSTSVLKDAYAEVDTPANQFEISLIKANQGTGDALSKLSAYTGADGALFEVAVELKERTEIIFDRMQAKHESYIGKNSPDKKS